MDRASLAGVAPADAAARVAAFMQSRVSGMRDVTRYHKQDVIRRVLETLALRGADFSNAESAIQTFREYLRTLIERKEISESYASHIVKAWNSTVRTVFGAQGKPGEGLIMRGFPMRARQYERLDAEEMLSLSEAAERYRFKSDVNRDAFETYLELERSTGARIGSLVYAPKGKVQDAATFADVDYETGTIRFRHMKNKPSHEAVLTESALARLKQREELLRERGLWQGADTPIMVGCDGRIMTPQSVNKMLKGVAARAGIMKAVSTHRIRGSVGTHIGRSNPRLAAEQLGISSEVFEKHYNKPNLEDRLARRDILPGGRAPRTPEELVGQAWLDKTRGKISEAEFRETLERAEKLRALPTAKRPVPETSPYL
jgi:integrase